MKMVILRAATMASVGQSEATPIKTTNLIKRLLRKTIFVFSFIGMASFLLAQTQIGNDIDGEAIDDKSGSTVSISANGTRVAIGASLNGGNGNYSGHVRVYDFDGTGWTQVGSDIDGEAAGDNSGNSVSISADGTRVAIGSTANDGNGENSGHVRVYDFDGADWVQVGSDIDGEAANDASGGSVSMSSDGTTVAIGARWNKGNGDWAGHIRVYEFNGTDWAQVGNDIDSEAAYDALGGAVSMSSDGARVAIGATRNDGNGSDAGHVRVYEFDGTGWAQVGNDIDGEAAGDNSGWSVSMSSDGTTVAIGAPYNDGNGSSAGHVRVYEFDGTGWVQVGSDIDGEAVSDLSGGSVSISADGARVTIGAIGHDLTNGASAEGHVRVYDFNGTSWVQSGCDIYGEAILDFSSTSVSISADGTKVAIGSELNDGNGYSSGHVRVYDLADLTSCNPGCTTSSVIECDGNPCTVGDTQILAADGSECSCTSGTVDATSCNPACDNENPTISCPMALYTQLGADIDGEVDRDESGYSTSLSSDGNIVAIGSFLNDGNGDNAGHVRVFQFNGTNWMQLGSDIDGEAAGDKSSSSLSLSADGSTLAIGARSNSGNGFASGHIRIFQFNGTNWIQLGSDIDGEAAYDVSGDAVSLSANGNILAVGAIGNDGNGDNSGHVRMYQFNGTNWIQLGNDIDGEESGDQTGHSVSLSADGYTVATGAIYNDGNGYFSGHTQVFQFDGMNWIQLGGDIDGEAAGDQSGFSVSLSADGNILATGSRLNDGNGDNSGHVQVYEFNGTNWIQLGADIDGEAAQDNSGYATSLSADGKTLAIGAQNNNGNGSLAGHVRIFRFNGTNWIQIGTDIDSEAEQDRSGTSVSLSADGNTLAIGAPGNDGNGTSSGHVRIYRLKSEINASVDTGSCEATGVALGTPITSDNCFGEILTNDAPTAYPIGTTTVTWTVTDAAGNTATCSQTVTVTDDEAPLISCPADVNVSTDAASCEATGVALGTPVASDNCSGQTVTNDAPTVYPIGTTTVTWTVTDAVGNTATCEQTVTVTDDEIPLISCPMGFYAQLGADINGEAAGHGVGRTVSMSADGNTLAVGVFTDNVNGNTAGHVQVFQFNGTNWTQIGTNIYGEAAEDQLGYSISLSADGNILATGTPYNDENGDRSGHVQVYEYNGTDWIQLGADIDGEAAYDESGYSVALSSDGYTLAIGARYNDGNGNGSGQVRVYQFNGTSWMQVGTDIDGEAAGDLAGRSVSLSADGNTVAIGAIFNGGNGNTAGHVRVFQFNGTSWVQIGIDIDAEAAGDWSGSSISLSANGSILAIGAINNDGVNGTDAGHVRVYGFNGTSWVQLGTDIDGEAAGDWSGGSVSLSADGNTLAIGARSNDENGSGAGHVRVYQFNGTSWVQIGTDIDGEAAADQLGRSVSLSADGNTLAIGAPGNDANGDGAGHVRIYTLKSEINVSTDAGSCEATGVALGTPITSDNCSGETVTNDAPAVYPIGTTTVTWTVTDAAGNTANCEQTVIVTDDEVPTISCPANVNVSADAGSCEATGVALGTPIASDNCSGETITNDAPTYPFGTTTVTIYPIGTTTVTWTVTDALGNTTTCAQTVTVTDDEAPTISCPTDVNVSADAGSCEATGVALGTPIASDNCSGETVTNDAPTAYPIGTTTVTWTVTDAAGNTTTCEQTVTVTDDEAPTISCPADVNVSPDAGSCEATGVALGTPIASDNCSGETVNNDAPLTYPIGTTTVIWTVIDAAGNTATCTQTVTVTDDEAPVAMCNDISIILIDRNPYALTQADIDAIAIGSSDNCAFTYAITAGTTTYDCDDRDESFVVTLTFTDDAGNQATCDATVTVTDPNSVCNNPPTALCQNITVAVDANCEAMITAEQLDDGSADPDQDPLTLSLDNYGPFGLGIHTITLTVDDDEFTAQCTAEVTVIDDTNPVLDTPVLPDVTGECEASIPAPTATDNCTGSITGITSDPLSYTEQGTYTITWNYDDDNGNIVTQEQTVIINDITPPTVACQNLSILLDATGQASISAADINNGSADNCTSDADLSLSIDQSGFDCSNLGDNTITLTVDDNNGNVSICTAIVSVTGVDADGDGFSLCEGDLDDTDPNSYPGAPELCDGIDNDFDGAIDQPANISNEYEWIEAVSLSDLNNVSGPDNGYTDFTSMSATLATGEDNLITLTPGYTDVVYSELWRVYIDFNQDGIFADPDERVFQSVGAGVRTGQINIPNTVPAGTTRMRVTMSYGSYSLPCDDDFEGEIEDYTVIITSCDALTDGGTIGEDEELCVDNNDPASIINLTIPGNALGNVEYKWLMNTTTDIPPSGNNTNGWVEIPGETGDSYDPGPITQTTWYIRYARNNGCTAYTGASNVVEKQYTTSCLSYCESEGLDTQYEWIRRVRFKTINNNSGDDGGYGDYTALSTDVVPGESRNIRLRPGFSSGSYTEYWRVWIDWNQDGDFEDAGEQVVQGTTTTNSALVSSISVPNDAAIGTTRMRVSIKYDDYPDPCETIAEGEVEDYTINVTSQLNLTLPVNSNDENLDTENFSKVAIQDEQLQLDVFPNPAEDQVTIQLSGQLANSILTISDQLGRAVLTESLKPEQLKMNLDLTDSRFKSGTYLVTVTTDIRSITKMFVILK